MSKSFDELSGDEIVHLIDRITANLSGLFPPSMFPERAHWGLHEEEDYSWLRTDPPSEYPNWVFDARFTDAAADERIALIRARIDAGELPPLWVVGPSSRPADLGARLERHGFGRLVSMPGMAFDLRRLDRRAVESSPLRARGLSVREIATDAEFADWARVNITGFQEYFHGSGCEVGLYGRLRQRDVPPRVRFYGAWVDGQMVGAAQAVFYPQGYPARLVELHQCSVIPEQREHGIARRLVSVPLLEALEQSYDVATLYAEAKAEDPFWTSIGFRSYCQFHWYLPR
ncbi:MAG: GNAT family N-acetyltransferase [Gammaproteobacteria bacterium]|nr:GNAT family N-acetyltransferase [Gammaproteobacteria bacterium]